jgi:hypothetical protein
MASTSLSPPSDGREGPGWVCSETGGREGDSKIVRCVGGSLAVLSVLPCQEGECSVAIHVRCDSERGRWYLQGKQNESTSVHASAPQPTSDSQLMGSKTWVPVTLEPTVHFSQARMVQGGQPSCRQRVGRIRAGHRHRPFMAGGGRERQNLPWSPSHRSPSQESQRKPPCVAVCGATVVGRISFNTRPLNTHFT